MKLHRLVLALALPLLAVPAIARAETKLAYVDIQRAIQETDEGRVMADKLSKEADEKQKELNSTQTELKKEKDLLDRQASAMSEETRAQKAQELQQKVLQMSQKFEADRAHLQAEQQESLKGLLDKMKPMIAEIAQREGISMVVEQSALAYAPTSMDITDELVRLYNAKYKVAGAPPKKAKGRKK